MIFSDIAEYVGPTPNRVAGGMGTIMGVVLHVTEGSMPGSIEWGKNPASQISFHFGNPKTGQFLQLVDTDDVAWAEAAGNPHWISIENEGNSGDMLTPSQIANAGKVLAKLHQLHGVPLQISDNPDTAGLGFHAMGGPAWGNHPDCPGTPIIGQRNQILAAAAGHAQGPGVPYPGYMLRQGMGYPDQAQGEEIQTFQRRLISLGYSCGPWGDDGIFGRATAAAVGQFQLTHPACQSTKTNGTPDEIVGPRTWEVLFS